MGILAKVFYSDNHFRKNWVKTSDSLDYFQPSDLITVQTNRPLFRIGADAIGRADLSHFKAYQGY